MKKIIFSTHFFTLLVLLTVTLLSPQLVSAQCVDRSCNGRGYLQNAACQEITDNRQRPIPCIQVNQGPIEDGGTGIRIPTLAEILTFAIRAFFIIAGLAALLYLLLGALAWVTSGGDKENVSKAQSKITSAIIGVILVAVVLAVIVTLEQIVFARNICLGLSCPITIPSLIK